MNDPPTVELPRLSPLEPELPAVEPKLPPVELPPVRLPSAGRLSAH